MMWLTVNYPDLCFWFRFMPIPMYTTAAYSSIAPLTLRISNIPPRCWRSGYHLSRSHGTTGRSPSTLWWSRINDTLPRRFSFRSFFLFWIYWWLWGRPSNCRLFWWLRGNSCNGGLRAGVTSWSFRKSQSDYHRPGRCGRWFWILNGRSHCHCGYKAVQLVAIYSGTSDKGPSEKGTTSLQRTLIFWAPFPKQ